MAGGLTRLRTFRSLRYGDFRLLWVASVGTSGGYFFLQVLTGWLTYEVTGSALLTSVALGLATLPNLIGAPLGGVLVDSLDRRKVLMLVPAYQCALSVAFGLIVLLGLVETWHIFAFVLLMGSSWVILEPARMAIIPGIVGETRLVNAFSLVQLAFSTTQLAGPAVGGIVLATLGPGPAVFFAAGSQLAACAMAALMRTRDQSTSSVTLRSALSGLAGSFRLVRETPLVQALLLLAVISPLVVVPFSNGLMPVFAAEVFDVGPARLGALLSLIGAGSMTGTIVLASIRDVPRKGYAVMAALLTAALGLGVLALAPSFPVAVVAALVIGYGFTSGQALVSAQLQRSVPAEYRGRISGIWMSTWGTVVGGGLVAGSLAGWIGAPAAAAVGAGIVVAAAAAVVARYRPIRSLR